MKKIIAILITITLLSGFSVTAFAAGADGTAGDRIASRIAALQEKQKVIEAKKAENEAKRQQFATKKEEYTAFKTALMEKKDQMLANKDANLALAKENKQLRVDFLNSLNAIKDAGTTLSDATLAKIKDYNTQIKAILAGVKDTKGDIKEILANNKGFIKNKDYVAMNSAFEQIYTIQSFRNDELKQVNTILKEMVKLLATEV